MENSVRNHDPRLHCSKKKNRLKRVHGHVTGREGEQEESREKSSRKAIVPL